jgi:hypothetical protein
MSALAKSFFQLVPIQQWLLAPYPIKIAAPLPGFGLFLSSKPFALRLMSSNKGCGSSVACLRRVFLLKLVVYVERSWLYGIVFPANLSVIVSHATTP